MSDKPNPGSDEAVKAGCLCPVMDNGHGAGAYGGMLLNGSPQFWINALCVMHGGGASDD